ncbi:MAG: lipase family protein, partial [Candidatus Tectomicrobia bacterium]|nr:lipase family protein [Candidatus Tectomicrobia bacterium]
MSTNAARHHIDKVPINQWAQKFDVTDTAGHERLVGKTLRIHGKGAFEVLRVEDGQIYLNGKENPIPISVLTDANGAYSAWRADGSQFVARVDVVTGNRGAISQEERRRNRRPRKFVSFNRRQLEKLEFRRTDVEELNCMHLTWDYNALDRTDPLNVVFGFEMAKLAYVDPIGKIQKALEQPRTGFKEVRAFDCTETDTQAFIAVTPDEKGIVIAFRGTTPGKDLLTDLSVSFEAFALGGQAHEGFQHYVLGVKTLMYEHLEKVMEMYPDAKVFGAGHSLGAAAIANFMGTALGENVITDDQVGRVVLAGCPRVLDWKAARPFNQRSRARIDRCVNGSDIVTKVPAILASLIASGLAVVLPDRHPGLYKHVGTFAPNVFFDTKGRETSNRSMGYRLWERIRSLKGQAEDHFLDNYLQCGYSWAQEKGRLPPHNVSQSGSDRRDRTAIDRSARPNRTGFFHAYR